MIYAPVDVLMGLQNVRSVHLTKTFDRWVKIASVSKRINHFDVFFIVLCVLYAKPILVSLFGHPNAFVTSQG
jgi:hypothetical protein